MHGKTEISLEPASVVSTYYIAKLESNKQEFFCSHLLQQLYSLS